MPLSRVMTRSITITETKSPQKAIARTHSSGMFLARTPDHAAMTPKTTTGIQSAVPWRMKRGSTAPDTQNKAAPARVSRAMRSQRDFIDMRYSRVTSYGLAVWRRLSAAVNRR